MSKKEKELKERVRRFCEVGYYSGINPLPSIRVMFREYDVIFACSEFRPESYFKPAIVIELTWSIDFFENERPFVQVEFYGTKYLKKSDSIHTKFLAKKETEFVVVVDDDELYQE